jgi:Domain of unknown function/Glycosyl hydrolase-like 10
MADRRLDGIGLANQIARSKGLQARVLWIDATANIDRYNTETKVIGLVHKIAEVGFNTVVFDVKPISGQTVYPSKLAPRLAEWRGKVLPPEFDPLKVMSREAHAAGLSFLVSLNAFSEGHRIFKVGPGYDRRDQQTVLYDPVNVIRGFDGSSFPLATKLNTPTPGAITEWTSADRLPSLAEGDFLLTIRPDGAVQDGFLGPLGVAPTIPKGGYALIGSGLGATFLQRVASPGVPLGFDTDPVFVPISERPEQQIPLMMNPNDDRVRKYALGILSEVVTNYEVDGVLYDDRLRYGGMNADFSETTRDQFEKVVGKKLKWPDDVWKATLNPNLSRGIRPGKFYEAWMTWRAGRLRDYVQTARDTVRRIRPGTLLGVYAGSWYGEYPALGSNWATADANAGFWFTTPNYRKTGFADLIDLLIVGCYYSSPTVYAAMGKGTSIGATVEAAGATATRLTRDQCWTYAGIMLSDFKNDPHGLEAAMQAALTATQGVMVFDLSHDIEPMWPTFANAFRLARKPPHATKGALADVRRLRKAVDAAGGKEPPIVIAAGSAGTGQ